jgi:hypothetical protein
MQPNEIASQTAEDAAIADWHYDLDINVFAGEVTISVEYEFEISRCTIVEMSCLRLRVQFGITHIRFD